MLGLQVGLRYIGGGEKMVTKWKKNQKTKAVNLRNARPISNHTEHKQVILIYSNKDI